MPRRRLSKLFIDKIKPPASGRAEYFDTAERGLVLRVTSSGHASWSVVYRVSRKLKRYTIGPYAEGKAAREEFTVEQARERARQVKALVREGKDPAAAKRAGREALGDDAGTLKTVAYDWLALHVKRHCKASTYKESKRILDRDVFDLDEGGSPQRFAGRKIEDIKFDEIRLLVSNIVKRGADVHANRVQKRLHAMFNWAVAERRLAASPITDMPLLTAEKPRDRYLNDDEIVWFWKACEKIGWPFGELFQLLLTTAQRRDEVGQMQWSEVDLDKKIWTKPREKAKNDKAHIVHLSDAAVSVLRSLPGVGRGYVFSRDGKTFVTGFTWGKKILDKAMAALAAAEDKTVAPFILHDLRRSAATAMASINVPPHVVDRILNHVGGTIRGVAAVYNKYEYLPEREAALKAWGNYVESLVSPKPSNVVDLVEARA
jgi:integrase